MPPENKDEAKKVELKKGEIVVSQDMLTRVMEQAQKAEKAAADATAKAAGLEQLFSEKDSAPTTGEKKLRERKNFEPAFRTVTVKQFPVAGNVDDMGYVIGWDNRGAYQKVDRTGVAPVVIDYINIIFLGRERNKDGKLQAEAVPLLSLINAPEVNCKILDTKDYLGKPFRLSYPPTGLGEKKMPTGEEISVTVFDPKHGLMETGDTIDGWVGFTDLTYVIQIPGVAEPLEIDSKYVNI